MMAVQWFWRKLCPVAALIIIAVYFIVIYFCEVDIRPQTILFSIIDPPGNHDLGIVQRDLARQLAVIRDQLADAAKKMQPPPAHVLDTLNSLVQQLDPAYRDDFISQEKDILDVCPEKYINASIGYYMFTKGWETVNCTNVRQIEEVISILLLPTSERLDNCSQALTAVLMGIQDSYPTIPVYVAQMDEKCFVNALEFKGVSFIPFDSGTNHAKVWNKMVSYAQTPYVLIGRDLFHFSWFARLERQIQLLSSSSLTQVVGGAFRNTTGHWFVECEQSLLYNYILRYTDGYYVSRNECMVCDYAGGPFVTRVATLKKFPFDTTLPSNNLFDDFFLSLRMNSSNLVLVCPDIMHFALDSSHFHQNTKDKDKWLPLAKKWELNRLILPDGTKLSFSCSDIGISCKFLTTTTKSFLMPICCWEQYGKALEFLDVFANKHNILYELDSGSILGAVKMKGLIPWDIDGDTSFHYKNYSFLEKSSEVFQKAGFKLTNFIPTDPSLRIMTPDIMIEMYGSPELSNQKLLPPELRHIPTKVLVNGVWIRSTANPGLYARNRYGKEILRHAQSWRHLGKKSSWSSYDSGTFKPCQKQKHHACLDLFPTDGNIWFRVP